MAANQDAQVKPVKGEVFSRSAGKAFLGVAGFGLLFLFGVGLVYAFLTDTPWKGGDRPEFVTWWGFLMGLACMGFGPVFMVLTIRAVLRKQRVVVGKDRLQILERIGGRDVVVFQVPYTNIAKLKYEVTEAARRIGIKFKDTEDPATFDNTSGFEFNAAMDDKWHFCIQGGFQGGLKAIHEAILTRFTPPTKKKSS
jgi:hypothetical protein